MKLTIVVLVGVVATVAALPRNILNLDLDDIHHDMSIDSEENDLIFRGSYSWTSPEGVDYFVRYLADHHGYRVLESNAVPSTLQGILANGEQGSFSSEENSLETLEID